MTQALTRMTGAQLAALVDKTANKALFDFYPEQIEESVLDHARWEMWNVHLAAQELALRIREFHERVDCVRSGELDRGDDNAEHRLGSFELLGVR